MLMVMMAVLSRRPGTGVRLEHAATSDLNLVLQETIGAVHPRPVEAPSFSEVLAHCGELILREYLPEAESHHSQRQHAWVFGEGMWAQTIQHVERAPKSADHGPLAHARGSQCRARRRILAQNPLHKHADGLPAVGDCAWPLVNRAREAQRM